MNRSKLVKYAFLPALIMLALSASLVAGFAEEDLHFRYPFETSAPSQSEETVSTIHDDLTYIMSVAAGLDENTSRSLEMYNQLVDSEKLTFNGSELINNCSGIPAPAPDMGVVSAACPSTDLTTAKVAWPMTYTATCGTSRFGPYSPFFHFPHQTEEELGALRRWGWGDSQTLPGYAAYAWGGPTVMTATCTYKHPENIETGMQPGSIAAFATYLHSMADSYSHRDCLNALAALPNPAPWGTHTQKKPGGEANVYACDYNPQNMQNDDAHGREFGSNANYQSDSARTDQSNQAVFTEITRWGLARQKSVYYPFRLDTVVAVTNLRNETEQITFQQALYNFVHLFNYNEATARRAYGDRILQALKASQRSPTRQYYLPMISN
jgi:hypothetical protein